MTLPSLPPLTLMSPLSTIALGVLVIALRRSAAPIVEAQEHA